MWELFIFMTLSEKESSDELKIESGELKIIEQEDFNFKVFGRGLLPFAFCLSPK